MRSIRLAAAVLSAVGLVTCADAPSTIKDSGPRPPSGQFSARLSLAGQLSPEAQQTVASLAAVNLAINNVRIVLIRPPADTLRDTIVAVTAGQSSLTTDLTININGVEETLSAVIQLRDGSNVLFSGTQEVRAVANVSGVPPVANPPVPLGYVGPGASATRIEVSSAPGSLAGGATRQFTAAGFDAANSPVPDLIVGWSTTDGTIATIDPVTGLLTAGQTTGTVTVRATSPNQVVGEATLTVVLPPSKLELVSGGGQTAPVGSALPQPLVVRALAADDSPVPGVVVQFAVVSGGGAVSAPEATTDAQGLAQVTATLGTAPGENSYSASIDGVEQEVTFTATAAAPRLVTEPEDLTTVTVTAGEVPALVFRVLDHAGAPLAAVPLSITIGSESQPMVIETDAEGRVTGEMLVGAAGGRPEEAGSFPISASGSHNGVALAGSPRTVTLVVQPAAAEKLVYVTMPPASVAVGASFAVSLKALDRFDNLATAFGESVTIALASNPNSAVLGGTLTRSAAGGTVTFDGLTVDRAGEAYTLQATSGELTAAVSSSFSTTAVAPTGNVFGAAHAQRGPSTLYSIDRSTGAATAVGPIGFNQVGAMDFHPATGVLYATAVRPSDATPVLITINPATGVGSEVGPTGISDRVADVSFRTDGTLFLFNVDGGEESFGIFVVNLSSGAATLVGLTGTTDFGGGNGIAFDAADVLFHSNEARSYRLDTGTGAATLIAEMQHPASCDFGRVAAADLERSSGSFVATIMCGSGESTRSTLFGTVNYQSGVVSAIGQTVTGLDAIAVRNPPGSEQPPATTLSLDPPHTGAIELVAGDPVPAGTPGVRLMSASGAPLAGVTLGFTVTYTDGQAGFGLVTNADGLVTMAALIDRLGGVAQAAGTKSVRVSTAGSGVTAANSPFDFSIVIRPAAPATIARVAGDGQTAAPGAPVEVAPAVLVADRFGNPIPGVGVTFTVISGGGSVTGGSAMTTSEGIASVGSWTLGGEPGSNVLRAVAQGLEDEVVFSATAEEMALAMSVGLVDNSFVGVSFSAPLRVTLNQPAPQGGLVVTVVSETPARLTVASPGTISIPAGSLSGTIQVTGVEAGTATVRATATGVADATASISVSLRLISLPTNLNVPFGQNASIPIQLAEPAPAGGTLVTLTSSDESRVEVVTGTVTVAAGSTTGNGTLHGVFPGTATVTATATDYIAGTSNVTTAANLDIVQTSVSLNPSFGTPITIRLRSAGQPVSAPAPGVTVTLTPGNADCVAGGSVVIPSGFTEVSFTLNYGGTATVPCNTVVVASAQDIQSDQVTANVGALPGISIGSIFLGSGLQRSLSGNLGASNHGGTTVRVTSADPARFLVAPSANVTGSAFVDLPVTAGNTGFSFVVQALESLTDTLTVTATAPGFSDGAGIVRIVRPAVDINPNTMSLTTLTGDVILPIRVGITSSGTGTTLVELQAVRIGGPGLALSVTNSDGEVASLVTSSGVDPESRSVTIAPGQTTSGSTLAAGGVALRPLGAGTTVVSAASQQVMATTNASRTFTVTAPSINLGNGVTVGSGLQRSYNGSLSVSTHGGITVRVASPDVSKLLIAPNASTPGSEFIDIAVLNGSASFSFIVQAMEGIADTIQMTAVSDGWTSGTAPARIIPPAMDIQSLILNTTTLSADNVFVVRLGLGTTSGLTELQAPRAGGPGVTVSVTSSDSAVAALLKESVSITNATTVFVASQQTQSPNTLNQGGIALRPRTAGSTIVSASSQGFVSTAAATRTVTVTASSLSASVVTVGAGLQRSTTLQLGATNHGGTTVRITSPDPQKVLVAPNASTAGSAFIDVTVPDGQQSASFFVQGLESVTDTLDLALTAQGFVSGSGRVNLVQSRLDIQGLATTTTTLSVDDPFNIRVGVGSASFLNELQPARFGGPGLTVTITSSSPAGQLVTSSASGGTVAITLPAGASSTSGTVAGGGVALRPLSAGSTNVTASIPGFGTTSASTIPVTITAPGITIGAATVGTGLQRSASLNLATGNHGGVTVRITSANPDVLLVSPNSTTAGAAFIDIPLNAGTSGVQFFLQGASAQTGNIGVTASAQGFTDGTTSMSVITSLFDIQGLSLSQNTASALNTFTVRVGVGTTSALSELQSVRAGGSPLVVTLSSSNPSVGRLVTSGGSGGSVEITIPLLASSSPGTVNGGGVAFEALAAGSTSVTASIPGFTPTAAATRSVEVAPAFINFTASTVGAGLQRNMNGSLSGGNHGGVTVVVSSGATSRLLVTSTTGTTEGTGSVEITVAPNATGFSFTAQAIDHEGGPVPISISAPGFATNNSSIPVVQAALDLVNLATSMSAGGADDPFNLRVGIPNSTSTALVELQSVRAGTTLPITVVSGTPSVGQLVKSDETAGSVIVNVGAGNNQTPGTVGNGGVAFRPLAAGTTTVQATAPGFRVLPTSSVTVNVSP
jgi:hypothetical protein